MAEAALNALVAALLVGGLVVWVQIVERWRSGQPILPPVPHRGVPWGGVEVVMVFALAFAAMLLVPVICGIEPETKLDDLPPDTQALMFQIDGMVKLVVLGLAIGLLTIPRGETPVSIGVVSRWRHVPNDVWLGAAAFLAATPPVYAIQAVLVQWFPSEHVLVKLVQEEPSSKVLVMAVFAAVLVAPVFEEFLFRLVLQGWLEKWENRVHPWEERMPVAGATDESEPPAPPRDARARGAIPILISSGTFALLHAGHGPDPIPLFLLAVILGYLYQRTQRLLPCIVTHALFNGLSLAVLWLSLE